MTGEKRALEAEEDSFEFNGQTKKLKFRNYLPFDKNLRNYYTSTLNIGSTETSSSSSHKFNQGYGAANEGEGEMDQRTESQAPLDRPTKSNDPNRPNYARYLEDGESFLDNNAIVIEREMEILRKEATKENGGADINIIPKKINWDLKAGIQKKLDKLKKRTQRAIVEMLREKFSLENSTTLNSNSNNDGAQASEELDTNEEDTSVVAEKYQNRWNNID